MKTCKLKSNAPCAHDIITKCLIEDLYSEEQPFVRHFIQDNHTLTILVAEDYYLRINSTLSVIVIIDERAEFTEIEITANGGKSGLLQEGYGAEKSAVKKMVKILKQLGFIEVEN